MSKHVFVIVDYTDPARQREVTILGHFATKDEAARAAYDWRELMQNNRRRYKVKAKKL
jgi:hypothetical protein